MDREKVKDISLHEQAVGIMERHIIECFGGTLEARAVCNECGDSFSINLVKDATRLVRNKNVGSVRPDLSVFDADDRAIRFIEIVDSHKPESNVHKYALENKIDVIEFHLNAKKEFAGRRRNKALDASLTVKARIQDLEEKRLEVDAHTLLCQRPKCEECSSPLPHRTVIIKTVNCWKCDQNINVAVGYKDGHELAQDNFTNEELEFSTNNGVILDRRFSSTAKTKYLANVCPKCDNIQGNWFLHMDPYHSRFTLNKTEKHTYGPCDQCSVRFCPTHDAYFDYTGRSQCPACVAESEKNMCPNKKDRECYYPKKCADIGCYFRVGSYYYYKIEELSDTYNLSQSEIEEIKSLLMDMEQDSLFEDSDIEISRYSNSDKMVAVFQYLRKKGRF